jgi:lysine 2,3-aminomutase
MRIRFEPSPRQVGSNQYIDDARWSDWNWQMRASLKCENDFRAAFALSPDEEAGFKGAEGELKLFEVRTTPYYAALASSSNVNDPIRRILMPRREELHRGLQSMLDPLGERRNSPTPRIVHRYPDRVLFLVTDFCSVYCRYCTRKHFTGGEASFAKKDEYQEAIDYIRRATGIREVILSGGDPLTLSDSVLDRVLTDLRDIDHVEIIRIGSRMPVVNPMRVTDELIGILKKAKPVFLMTHFNHPRELTLESANAIEKFVDGGIPVFNQMVLLNGVNNSPAIIQALSRRLLFLRAKPYYMFQCDPSFGTDHLRTSIEESLEIQAELWGRMSGLAMPNLSLDIPDGGGKAGLTPSFERLAERTGTIETGVRRVFEGWDGVRAEYKSPPRAQRLTPADEALYEDEWQKLVRAKDVPPPFPRFDPNPVL